MKKALLLGGILALAVFLFGCQKDNSVSKATAKTVADTAVQIVPGSQAILPKQIKAVYVDISGMVTADSTAKAIVKGADFAVKNGFDTVTVSFNPYAFWSSGETPFQPGENAIFKYDVTALQSAISSARQSGVCVLLDIDVFAVREGSFAELCLTEPVFKTSLRPFRLNPSKPSAAELLNRVFEKMSEQLKPNGYILSGLDYLSDTVNDAAEVQESGLSAAEYRKNAINRSAKTVTAAIRKNDTAAFLCYDTKTPILYADRKELIQSELFDAVVGAVSDSNLFDAELPVIVSHKAGSETYCLANEYTAVKDKKQYAGSIYSSLSELSGSRILAALKLAFENKIDNETKSIEISVSSPQNNSTTEGENIVIQGTCDNNFPLLMNGQAVTPTSKGSFAVDYKLKNGKNVITFEHKDKKTELTVTYYMRVIRDISPSAAITIASENEVGFSVYARKGAAVKGVINGATLTFRERDVSDYDEKQKTDDGFALFEAIYKAPSNNKGEPVNIGVCTVTATYKGFVQSLKSGSVSVLDKWGPRSDNKRYIAEVTAEFAETFDGDMAYAVINKALPTNVFLPKGTKDYVVGEVAYSDGKEDLSYYKLACGKRIYQKDSKLTLSEEVLTGGLASITSAQNGRFTDLLFDTPVKSPFAVDFGVSFPYFSKAAGKYDFNCSYTPSKIEFILPNINSAGELQIAPNALFSSASVAKQSDNSVKLTLNLTKAGRFYGFTSFYNESGKLVLRFVNPTTYSEATGFSEHFKVVIDPGHGNYDPGALGCKPKEFTEKVLNLRVSLKLRELLQAAGAEVVMSRSDDSVNGKDRLNDLVTKESPSLMISVHHNSSTSSSPFGPEMMYYYPFNQGLAGSIVRAIDRPHFATPNKFYYQSVFVLRSHECMKALVECGYLSNASECDFAGNNSNYYAERIFEGIKNYYRG